MKLKDIADLNLGVDTQKDINIDVTAAIVSDEFNRLTSGNYRERVIERLIKNKLPINNNNNIAYELVAQFVSVKCPYCETKMAPVSGGGSSTNSHVTFKCKKCKAECILNLHHQDGLNFNPTPL